MTETENTYNSLDEIRLRKEKLQGQIAVQETAIRLSWTQLFHPEKKNTVMTPTKRFTSLLSTSAGVLDGIILGWKIYRRFKK